MSSRWLVESDGSASFGKLLERFLINYGKISIGWRQITLSLDGWRQGQSTMSCSHQSWDAVLRSSNSVANPAALGEPLAELHRGHKTAVAFLDAQEGPMRGGVGGRACPACAGGGARRAASSCHRAGAHQGQAFGPLAQLCAATLMLLAEHAEGVSAHRRRRVPTEALPANSVQPLRMAQICVIRLQVCRRLRSADTLHGRHASAKSIERCDLQMLQAAGREARWRRSSWWVLCRQPFDIF